MKMRKIIPAIALAVFFCLATSSILQAQGMPHAIIGKVTVSNGQTVGNATVTLANSRTDATLSTTTNSLGQYQADLSAMSGGYQVGDVITVRAESSNGALAGTSRVTVSGSALDECDVIVSEKGVSSSSIYLVAIVCVIVAITVILAIALSRDKPPVKDSGKGRRRR